MRRPCRCGSEGKTYLRDPRSGGRSTIVDAGGRQGVLDDAQASAHSRQRARPGDRRHGGVFVTAGRAFGGALFDVTGGTSPVWEQVGLSAATGTPACSVNGFLYGPDGNNSEGAGRSPTSLRSLDWRTGEITWTEPKLGFNGLIAVGGKLLVLTEMGELVLVEASSGAYKELGSRR